MSRLSPCVDEVVELVPELDARQDFADDNRRGVDIAAAVGRPSGIMDEFGCHVFGRSDLPQSRATPG